MQGGTNGYRFQGFKQASDEWKRVFVDLDANIRCAVPPKELIDNSRDDEPSPELLKWAEKQEVDLIGIEMKPAGSDRVFYCLKPVGMRVWRLHESHVPPLPRFPGPQPPDTPLFARYFRELQKGNKIDLGEPIDGVLAPINPETGKYDSRISPSYLFLTREGACGTLELRQGGGGGGPFNCGEFDVRLIYDKDTLKGP